MVLRWLSVVAVCLTSATAAQALDIKRWNPPGLSQPNGYAQVVTITGPHKQILLGGKAGLRADGSIPESLAEQTKLTFDNITRALAAEGATPSDVVEIQIFIVDLQKIDPQPVYEAVRGFFPADAKPVSMVIGVSALAIPALKLEINVRAVVPVKGGR